MTPRWARSRAAVSGHAQRLAIEFWARAGAMSPPPRDPAEVISLVVPVSMVGIAHLDRTSVAAWMTRLRLPPLDLGPERALRGCLLAMHESAYLLYDSADPPAEQRMTLAHELGHFLIEVEEPRRQVRRALGEDALALLNGDRAATYTEQLDAVLSDISLDLHVQLMTRDDDGSIGCVRIAAAEDAADAFALELLAPQAEVWPLVRSVAAQPPQTAWALVSSRLIETHGLPAMVAGGYASRLLRAIAPDPSVWDLIGM